MAAPDHSNERQIALNNVERGRLLVEMQRTRCAQQEERGYDNRESRKLLRELEAGLRNLQTYLQTLGPDPAARD